jgi:hypothetical protein
LDARLRIDRDSFLDAFDERPLAVGHGISRHPLLELEALAVLAESLPERSIERNRGDLPSIVDPDAVEQAPLSPGEVARTIETNGCWMVLKNIEQDPGYKALLDELLDPMEAMVSGRDGGMTGREGFVFLSAPDSTTPSHIDPEHNFLLQARGTKNMVVGRFPDPKTEQLELEQTFGKGGHRNIQWEPVDPQTFHLEPGDGVYVPPHAPHLVKNGPTPSVSLSITFQTATNEQAIRVHAFNSQLRRLGLSPAPPGRRSGIDRQKAVGQRALNRLRRLTRT